jgi:hypothetical protein
MLPPDPAAQKMFPAESKVRFDGKDPFIPRREYKTVSVSCANETVASVTTMTPRIMGTMHSRLVLIVDSSIQGDALGARNKRTGPELMVRNHSMDFCFIMRQFTDIAPEAAKKATIFSRGHKPIKARALTARVSQLRLFPY